ncbi:hypothetical protein [Patiriisocius hiemis]|uniref:Uncharacterized protein n=1 Tax=Patiriisocius hiemis TaxID=3075604 RepID=A0ABU2Y9H9_9FLAO|nr:hypothetical protein [Constantimarinum sp. W242]MDT0554843.1 hypothetical protein [Constantimarinum sp. W242]
MKLFSKSRKKSVTKKRLGNYLLYAIGEIILVVIGILIAVSINNLNEARKTKLQVQDIAEQVHKKIKDDIAEIDMLTMSLNEDLKLYNLYLANIDTLTEKQKKYRRSQAPYLVTYSVDFLPFNPVISTSIDKATITNDSLSLKLLDIEQVYKQGDKNLKLTEQPVLQELLNNINYIKDNFSWYEKFLNGEKFTLEEYSYFESSDYRNRVVHMKSFYLESYSGLLEVIKGELVRLQGELEELL